MNIGESGLFALSVLGFLALTFVPIEKAFPAKKNQKIFRPYWIVDLCFFAGQYLFWNSLVLFSVGYFEIFIPQIFSTGFLDLLRTQPLWLQGLEVLLLSDVCIYWGHRLQHKVGFLWRFHKVHHSAEHLDWLAAHREHPLDSIYSAIIINLPPVLLGFPLETLALVIAFRGVWAIFIHSNVKFPLGPLKKLIGSPDLHHWHHDKNRQAGNYANISPLMDIIFGTYTCPDHEPKEFGIHEEFPKSYLGQLIGPLIPKRFHKNLFFNRRIENRQE